MATASSKLEELISWYRRQYDYTRSQALSSIMADLRDITATKP